MARLSEWDSDVFGYRVGTHSYTSLPRDLGNTERLDVVFARGPYQGQLPDARSTVFEVQLDLCCKSRARDRRPMLLAINSEMPDVFRIAEETLVGHRWACDERLAPHAKKFYRKWLASAHERGEIYVAPASRGCAGFVVIEESDGYRRLSLIAVDPELQRLGHGRRLLEFFLDCDSVCRVKTWVTNLAALNLYFKHGFKVESVECVEHVWL